MEDRAETSVWHVAIYAMIFFVGIMVIGNMMIGSEAVIVTAQ